MLYFRPEALADAFAGIDVSPQTEFAYPVLDCPAAAHAFLALHDALAGAVTSQMSRDSLLIATLAHLVDHGRLAPAPMPSAIKYARRLIDSDPVAENSLEPPLPPASRINHT
jgi:hypothetical protein